MLMGRVGGISISISHSIYILPKLLQTTNITRLPTYITRLPTYTPLTTHKQFPNLYSFIAIRSKNTRN